MSAKSLAAYLVLSTALIFAVFVSPALAQGTLYEGARLITGDGSAIEDSSFFVEGNQFTRIGRKGELALPDGSARIDLTGKTVMPALIDTHVHLGYRKGLDFSPSNYTRENVTGTLDRFAYYGVGAILETGTARGDLAYQMRNELATFRRKIDVFGWAVCAAFRERQTVLVRRLHRPLRRRYACRRYGRTR